MTGTDWLLQGAIDGLGARVGRLERAVRDLPDYSHALAALADQMHRIECLLMERQ